MSKTVDQRVVEMRFDNRHFEKNAKETLSTLDKLKMKLNLSGASKGLDEISKSAGKVNMNPLSNALSTVTNKFSALEIMGVTALVNITNSAVNAGKRIVESLTVAPVGDGFKEYELMLNAVQTTMAGTGLTAKEVEAQLKQLDEYADKTVYSTADMLNNLPKFTNAGVELEVATKAMIGIANATAHAGGDANKASIAFYNLGQAIGTGYLTRMDYNSINNAGIATMKWKNAMVEAAIAAGTLVEVEEGLYSTGSQTLTLQQLFIDGLQDQWATTDVLLKVLGDYGDETTEIGKEAYKSAQKIKTFTMMMESLKATAGTGWKDTWQIIFGDLDEATAFWTGINDFISGIINRIADFRNKLLGGALGKTFAGLFDGIKQTAQVAKDAIQPLLDYTQLVDDIISGSWGNAPTRWEDLAAAGYDWAHAQNLVNEKLGSSVRHATNFAKAQEKVINSQEKSIEMTTDYILKLLKMSDAELKALGYTKDQIAAFRELERVSKKSGISLRTWIEHIDEIDGRWILIQAFENAFGALGTVIGAVKDAWVETIGVIKSDHLYEFILVLHKLSTMMKISDSTADKLKRTFAGVFAVLDMIFTLTKGPLMLLGRVIVLFLQSLTILPRDFFGMTAVIGDYLVALRDWIDSVLDATDVIGALTPYLQLAIDEINKLFEAISHTEAYQKFAQGLRNTKAVVIGWMKALLEAKDIPKYIFEGLQKGLKEGIPAIIDIVINFGKAMLFGIRKVLGIHSPSTEFYEIGKNMMQGLFNGIKEFVKMVYSLVMSIGNKIIDIIKSLDIGSIFTILVGSGMIYSFVKIARALDILTGPLESLDDLLHQSAKTMKTFRGVLNTFKFRIIAESIKSIAVAIAILAGSVAVLSLLDQKKVWSAVGAIGALIVLLGALTAVVGHFGSGKGLELGKITLSLLGLSVAISIIAGAMKKMGKIEPERMKQALFGLITIMSVMVLLMTHIANKGTDVTEAAAVMIAMGGAFYLLALAAKKFAKMEWDELKKAGVALAGMTIALIALVWATQLLNRFSGPLKSLAGILLAIGGSMLMIAIAIRMFRKMDWDELKKAGVALGGLVASVLLIVLAINKFKGVSLEALGRTMLGIAGAMLIMVLAAKMIASMEWGAMAKAGVGLVVLVALIGVLIESLGTVDGSKLFKVGTTILSMAVAIGIMAGAAALLGMLNIGSLIKGVAAVGALVYMMKILIESTKKAKNINSTLIPLTVAIGILALSLGLLAIIRWDRLLASTVALSAVMGMLALVIHSTKGVTGAMKTVIAISVAIGILAIALGVLSKLPAENVLSSAMALSLVLGVLAVVMSTLTASGSMIDKALMGVLGIMALCIPLYMILEVLTKMDGLENATKNALALTAFMGMLALVQLACAAAGMMYAATGGLAATGLLGIVALVGTIYLLLGALAIMSNIKNASKNLEVLSKFLVTMTVVLTVLAIVGPLALIGVTAISALIGLIVGLGALAVAVGYLLEEFPNIEKFLNKGIPVLITLAGALGDMVGAFVGGVIEGISGTLPGIGTDLSKFMKNAQPFIDGAKKIDSSMMDGVKTLAEAILIITGTNLLESLASWLTGDKSLADFGDDIGGLGESLNKFITNLGTFTPEQVTTIKCACDAISALAKAAKNMPAEEGDWQKLAGTKSLATFGDRLPDLGTKLRTFVENLGVFNPDQVSTVSSAADAITALGDAAKNMPAEDGWWQKLVGGKSLETFGNTLPLLGTNLKNFVANIGTFTKDQVDTVGCAGEAVKALATAAKEMPAEDGWWQKIVGGKDLETFGNKLPTLGTNLKDFVKNLGTFNKDKIATVESAVSVIKVFTKLGDINLNNMNDNIGTFGRGVVNFGKKLKTFVDNMNEIGSEDVADAVTKTNSILSLAKTISKTKIDSLNNFGKTLKSIAKDGVKGFIKELEGVSPRSQAKAAAQALIQAGINGIGSKKTAVKNKANEVSKAAVKAFASKSLKADAEQAGRDLVQGLINGLNDKKKRDKVYNAAFSLGELAVQGELDGQQSQSPSKATERAGKWLGEGLIIGMRNMANQVYGAGKSMGETVTTGISGALNTAMRLLDTDMDAQPTIRPVLDLSDVESGIGNLNGMFNNNPSIGFTSNLKAISSNMNARNQNGSNSDVVSAIDTLSRKLGNVNGTTNNYNVNGITYDDGSSMSEAIKAIVRAAITERRT